MQYHLNEMQKAVAAGYAGGEFSYINDLSAEDCACELDQCGDGLFRFLMLEMSSSEGCTNKEECLRRIQTAIKELQGVADQISNAF